MVSRVPTQVGQRIRVPGGLSADCEYCTSTTGVRAKLVTDGTETAVVRRAEHFNGRFTVYEDTPAVWLDCPDCGYVVQFRLEGRV